MKNKILKNMKIKLSWPIGIIIIYGFFLVTLISFIIFTRYNQVNLVSEDYYQKEINYQKQIDRIERTRTLPESLEWKFLKNEDKIYFIFPKEISTHNFEGEVIFFRPSDSSQDIRTNLEISENNDQFIDIKHLARGYWKIKILWSVNDLEYFKEDIFVH